MSFPLVFLQQSTPRSRGVAVYHEEAELVLGASVGDVLQQELGLNVPCGAMVLVLDDAELAFGLSREARGAELLAAVLQAGIARSAAPLPISLCVWAFKSLSQGLSGANDVEDGLRVSTLARVLGFPIARASMSFEAYLQLVEPGFVQPRPDPELMACMSVGSNFSDWLAQLQLAFDHAYQRDLANS